MTCVATPSSLSDITDMITRCVTEYGGPHWQDSAMIGLAFLGAVAFFAGTLYLLGTRR